MDSRYVARAAPTRYPGCSPRHALALALAAIAWGAAAPGPAEAQTVVPAGQTVDKFGPVNLGQLQMQGGTIIFRDGFLGASTATNSILANGWIAAAGTSARLELYGDTTVPGATFGPSFPTDGMYIAASAAEDLFPLDVINKGQVFQTGNGKLTLGGGARFVNTTGSTYFIQNDLGMDRTSDLATASFVNRGGSVIKASGSSTSVFRIPVAENTGKFETWDGTIDLAAGVSSNSGNFFADGLGTNTSQFGITFGGSSTFTGIVTTETGGLLLRQRSRIRLAGITDFFGFFPGEWQQKANFLVDGFQSRIEISPGVTLDPLLGVPLPATLHNTGSLVTANGGAVVAVGAATGYPGSPARGLLLNEGSFQGVVLGTLDYATGPCKSGEAGASGYCVIDVRNTRGAEFTFQPAPEVDPSAPVFDPVSEANAVGIFQNAGRVRIPGVVDPLTGIATLVLADEFVQKGTPVVGQGPELVIDQDGELRVAAFSQQDGDTVVNGLLRGDVVKFLGGTLSGTGTIASDNFGSGISTGDVMIKPGSSPGILTIDGNLDAVGTTFDIEIAGLLPGVEYDQLIVLGQANPTDSILNLRFIDGFVPSPGDVFEWLVADPPFVGLAPLKVNVFSDLAFIDGEMDGRTFFVTSVTPVPLPPAAWALASGLLALGGLARRRRAALPVRESLLADA
jgi:hypothetical protein